MKFQKPFQKKLSLSQSSNLLKQSKESHVNKSISKTKQQLITQLINQWQQSYFVQKLQAKKCFKQFTDELEKQLGLKLKCDNEISNILIQKGKQMQFIQYSRISKPNQLKQTIQIMQQTFYQQNFITLRQYTKYKSCHNFNSVQQSIYQLIDSLKDKQYIKSQRIPQSQSQQSSSHQNNCSLQKLEKLDNIWLEHIKIPVDLFWQFVLQHKIVERELVQVYKVYRELIISKGMTQLKNRVKLHLKFVIDVIKAKKSKKQLVTLKQHISDFKYNQILQNRAQQVSAYLNKDRWIKFTQQYQTLVQALRSRCTKFDMIKFQTFGSFRSKFHITSYSDIDIVMSYQCSYLSQRSNRCKLLNRIKQSLDNDQLHDIPSFMYCRVFQFSKIRHPFIKIGYLTNYQKNLDIISSMDIVINNREGVENSVLLAEYAENIELLKLGNLVKYWANRTTLINQVQKIQGLSSYGVLLMVLYFLMVDKQIPFLQIRKGKYDIGSQKFRFTKSILQNFIAFLQFYSLQIFNPQTKRVSKGRFHRENRIVCLLEDHNGQKQYSQDFIVNMYDFIDHTNPGRMRYSLQEKYQRIFSQALTAFKNKSLEYIKQTFSEPQHSQKVRGNRLN